MARPRRTAPRLLRRQLDFGEKWNLHARCVRYMEQARANGRTVYWRDAAERRQAWFDHRDELLRWPRVTATRPHAYWDYEGPAELHDGDDIAGDDWRRELEDRRWHWLETNGLLIPGELDAINAERQHRVDEVKEHERIERELQQWIAAHRGQHNDPTGLVPFTSED